MWINAPGCKLVNIVVRVYTGTRVSTYMCVTCLHVSEKCMIHMSCMVLYTEHISIIIFHVRLLK